MSDQPGAEYYPQGVDQPSSNRSRHTRAISVILDAKLFRRCRLLTVTTAEVEANYIVTISGQNLICNCNSN